MMKVGILTFPNSKSFGASLQMYALYRAIKNFGYDVEIINYQNKFMKSARHVSGDSISKRIRLCISHLIHIRQKNAFLSFEKSYMNKYPSKCFTDANKLMEIANRYGAVICGSDQVWNPDITGNDINYFLSFCGENTKRIAYAPSFGVEALNEEFGSAIRAELMKFDALSVRENSGIDLVKQLIGKESTLVTDPTFLIPSNEWSAIEKKHPMAKGEYILYYTIRSSKNLWRQCKALSEKTGLRIIRVGGNPIKRIKNREDMIDYACDLSPSEWLSLVHNARYVVTNSFHGTAFSIIYHKDFYLEFSSLTNSRLKQITELAGLEERVLKDGVEIVPSSIDYISVDERLSGIKNKSSDYLKNALSEAKRYG
jgi:hypothetical protein